MIDNRLDNTLQQALARKADSFPHYGEDHVEGAFAWSQQFTKDLVECARQAPEETLPKLQAASRQLKSQFLEALPHRQMFSSSASSEYGYVGKMAQPILFNMAIAGITAGCLDTVIAHVLKAATPTVPSDFGDHNDPLFYSETCLSESDRSQGALADLKPENMEAHVVKQYRGHVAFQVQQNASFLGGMDNPSWECANLFGRAYLAASGDALAAIRGRGIPTWSAELRQQWADALSSFAGVQGVDLAQAAPAHGKPNNRMELVIRTADWKSANNLRTIMKDTAGYGHTLPVRVE